MRIPLNFDWDFVPGFENAYLNKFPKSEKVDIPHNAVMLDYSYFDESSYQGKFSYRKTFKLEKISKTTLIEFEGIQVQFDLYLNQHFVGHYLSGYVPVKVDVSTFVKKGENEIIVAIDSHEDPLVPPFGGEVDYISGAGIYRPVYLYTYEGSYLEDQFIMASGDGFLRIQSKVKGDATPTYHLYDNGKEIASFKEDAFQVEDVHPYSLEDPHLYELRTELDGETYSHHFGFRDVKWDEKGFFLNGKKVFLRGLNRHQLYPYQVAALPSSAQKEDARFLKYELGCNVVRTSHYPQSEDFLDECDRIGLLVLDEIPGWQHIGEEKQWRDNLAYLTRAMIIKERNHPSLIAYGLRIDESGDDHELYTRIQAIKAELDPTRPSLGVRNFKDSECLEDIYAYNDFSNESLAHGLDDISSWPGAKGKGKLVSESNGHMFPTTIFDETSRRVEHALRHAKVLDDAMGQEGLGGALSWCAFDYYTHKRFGSLDHICRHGVATLDRGKKAAAYFYQSQADDVPVLYLASSMQSSDYNAALFPPAIIFTNADEVDVYQGENLIGTFLPDRKNYPHLPHPPVVIDDWIGKRFDEPKISAKDQKTIIKGLNFSAQKGFNHLPFGLKIKMGLLMAKYHYSFTDVYNLYGKYINHWGSQGDDFTFVAKKGGQEVRRIKSGSSLEGHYEVSLSQKRLVNKDTFDTTFLQIQKKDHYGRLCHHAFDAFEVEVSGPIRLLGPKYLHLEGGHLGIYVASKEVKKESRVSVIIKGNGFEEELEIIVA